MSVGWACDGLRRGQRKRWCAWPVLPFLAGHLALVPSPASAESLIEALTGAYHANPRLDAERARLRATDEEVPRALSGYRPQVGASASAGHKYTRIKPDSASAGPTDPWTYEISVFQPVFTGFRTRNAVNEAEATVRAGREELRRVENEVLLEAATAYMDLVRDQAVVRFREQNLQALTRELEAANARRAAREVTRTDVAQAEARRARAVSAAEFARANVKVTRAQFARIVGHPASSVFEPPLAMKNLPNSIEEAIGTAEQESPNVVAALYREEAARYNVDKIWGERLPEVSVEANYAQRGETSRLIDSEEEASVTGRVSVPLYQGGEVEARVRQAKHTQVGRLQEIEQARTETVANTTSAWSRLMAARAQLQSDRVQVDANRIALDGVREEEKVGQRTLLDVLDAEQEYLDSQVLLVTTKRDIVVASYALLASMGRLTADAIALSAVLYDDELHYHEVREKWFGVSITHADGRTDSLTVSHGHTDTRLK